MAISATTFQERISRVEQGKTTSWTVPGEGLADVRDERSFLAKSRQHMATKGSEGRAKPATYLLALVVGAVSVILGRWLDFTFMDDALAFAAERGVDIAAATASVPMALGLAVVISAVSMVVLGLKAKQTAPLLVAGFVGALLFEADLVALAPELYAKFYPQSWIADMVASAQLVT